MDILISWTTKIQFPQSPHGNPDFIRLEATVPEDQVSTALATLQGAIASIPRPPIAQPAQASATASMPQDIFLVVDSLGHPLVTPALQPEQPAAEDAVVPIDRFTMARRPDGLIEVEMYGRLNNGKPMEYPEIREVMDNDRAAEMFKTTKYFENPVTLPIDTGVDGVRWNVTWKFGRKKAKGTGHYKDIVAIQELA